MTSTMMAYRMSSLSTDKSSDNDGSSNMSSDTGSSCLNAIKELELNDLTNVPL